MADSGEHIRTGARFAHLPGGPYARGAKFSTTQKETVKEYIHDWRMYYVDVTIDKQNTCRFKISLYAGNSLEPMLLAA